MTDNSRIPVLHIIKSLGRGGAEMLLPEALALHDQETFEFHYIYFLPWKDQMTDPLRHAGGRVTCFNASDNLKIMLKTGEVIQYCQDHGIRLIHCHLPWAGFLGRIVHKRTGIPIIYTEHNKQERYHRITFFLNKLTFNWQNRAIAVSHDVADSIATNIHPSIPVQTVLNGVNTAKFYRKNFDGTPVRKKFHLPADAFVIGTVAVFRFQKRLKEWMEIVAEVHQSHPEIRGLIIGDGPLKEKLHRHCEALGMQNIIYFTGLQEEVRPFLSAMDLYMMTSSFEGLPVALLEAMSMELPVVSTRAGGIGELVRNNQDGLTVDTDDWPTLKGIIERLIPDEALRKTLGSSARSRVIHAFSMERMVAELEKIYHEINSSV